MSSQLIQCKLLVKKSSIHGYGVFADQDIEQGTIIEECHTLHCTTKDSSISNYQFYIKGSNKYRIALGYGSIYNHSKDFNADYEYDSDRNIMMFHATRFIKRGEEIFIYYGDRWFSYRRFVPKETSKYKFPKIYSIFVTVMRFSLIVSVLIGAIFLIKT